MNPYDTDTFIQEFSCLSVRHHIAFAASCCERMLPNYEAAAVTQKWDNANLLREALNEVWKFVGGACISEERIRKLIQECEKVIPRTDFGGIFAQVTQYALIAVILTLETCIDGNAEGLVETIRGNALESLGKVYPIVWTKKQSI